MRALCLKVSCYIIFGDKEAGDRGLRPQFPQTIDHVSRALNRIKILENSSESFDTKSNKAFFIESHPSYYRFHTIFLHSAFITTHDNAVPTKGIEKNYGGDGISHWEIYSDSEQALYL
jgi:hypothetical protein